MKSKKYPLPKIILADTFNDKINEIFTNIPIPIMNGLFDLLIWKEGPRVRDLSSHGTLIPESITFALLENLLVMSIGICIHFDPFLSFSSVDSKISIHY